MLHVVLCSWQRLSQRTSTLSANSWPLSRPNHGRIWSLTLGHSRGMSELIVTRHTKTTILGIKTTTIATDPPVHSRSMLLGICSATLFGKHSMSQSTFFPFYYETAESVLFLRLSRKELDPRHCSPWGQALDSLHCSSDLWVHGWYSWNMNMKSWKFSLITFFSHSFTDVKNDSTDPVSTALQTLAKENFHISPTLLLWCLAGSTFSSPPQLTSLLGTTSPPLTSPSSSLQGPLLSTSFLSCVTKFLLSHSKGPSISSVNGCHYLHTPHCYSLSPVCSSVTAASSVCCWTGFR